MNMLAQIQNDNNTDQVTMVSLELVDYINDSRKFDEKPVQLRHADFMAKVPKVLGVETSEKFRSSYLAGNGEQRPCYRFPKREACLMAMSYSYELQAQIFDRMTAMEEALKKPALNLDDPAFLRQALLGYTEKVIELTTENQTLTKAIENITATKNGVKFQQACKILNVKQPDLAKWLRVNGWDRYINKSRASTHYSQERGYCETKFEEVDGVKPSGEPNNYTKIEFFILPKGMAVLAKHFGGGV